MIGVDDLILVLLNGVANGMLLFLVAVGLTLIFGVLGVINFAHGSLYMLGAYFTFFVISGAGVLGLATGEFWLALLLVPVLLAIVGGIIEMLAIRPIYDHDHAFQLLLTFALVLFIDNGARILFGTSYRSVNTPAVLDFQIQAIGGLPAYNAFIIGVGIAVVFLMWYLFTRTRLGKLVVVAAEDREITQALGVNVPLLFTAVFIVGSALAGLAGALAAPYRAIHPAMGESIIIDSFVVVVIGGMGSFSGALAGALLIGVVKSLAFLVAPGLGPVVPVLLMALVMFVHPKDVSNLFTNPRTLVES